MYFINTSRDLKTRYDIERFVEFVTPQFDSSVYDILSSYFWNQLGFLSLGGNFIVTGEDYRPELISWRIYGTTQYWWVILLYNNLINNEDIRAGMSIKYPLLQDLEGLYFRLNSLQQK